MQGLAGRARKVCFLLLMALVGLPLAPAIAGPPRTSSGSGLTMTVDTRWLPGPAYRRVLITLTPTAGSATDRAMEVEFLTLGVVSRGDDYNQRVVQGVEIPAGSGPVQVSMAVPQGINSNYQVNVYEDGRKLKALSQPWTADNDAQIYGFMTRVPRLLLVTRKAPNLDNLRQPLLEAVGIKPGPTAPAGRNVVPNVNAFGYPVDPSEVQQAMSQIAAPEELPRRWIEYSNYDLVLLSLDDLRTLQQQAPEAHQALLRWTRAGGNLLVSGMGANGRHLAELEQLTNLDPADPASEQPGQRGWSEPVKHDAQAAKRPQRPGGGMGGAATVTIEEAESSSAAPTSNRRLMEAIGDLLDGKRPTAMDDMLTSLSGDAAVPFLQHPLGAGMLVAWGSGDPYSASSAQWKRLYDSIGPQRLLWSQRHGLVVYGDNPDFWDFLIPGVGAAPVGMFRVLISLFVIVIGPVNYYLLRHWRRLYLLVVTVPVCAAVVTGVLLTYAIVADGLGTRVRVRSVTWLDQRHGEAVCWSRLSYYAGLTPSQGLRFSPDLVTLPLTFEIADSNGSGREMFWEDDQRLARGWLNARTPTQMLTVRARASDRKLELTPSADDPTSLQLTNRLETRVEQLLVRGPDDRYYWAERVEAGASAVAHAIERSEARQRLREVVWKQRPASSVPNSRVRRGNWQYSQYVMSHAGNGSQQTGHLETSFRGIEEGSLGPGQFLAVVAASPEVELGLPDAREEASLHVILGTW